ncbi:MAG: glycosyltransferase family 1 protein [Bryobacteraceae bacterium]|jgi:glycosyltransferase involved in cell wall biosynthesis
MHVVIDAVPLLIRSAGVKNYLYHWIGALRRAAGGEAIATFPALTHLGPLVHNASIAGPWRTGTGLGTLGLSNYSRLPVLDWLTRGADVFHTTHLVRHPPRRPRLTATIHDMTCWIVPELHPAANLRADRGFAAILRRADRLIAVSESTKTDAVRILGLPPEKITVIYSGIATPFFDPSAEAIHAIRARYGLHRPFVLFIGTIEPRKNIGMLLDAFEALPPSVRQEFELVIAGPIGWASAEITARVRRVRYLGYVPEPDLAALTAAATVFAYPSLYEGFGFPVAQAMAAGTPAITSRVSSLPEITGDAALLIDPRSLTELRDALSRLLLTPTLRAELAARGRSRARAFRWEECAARSMRFFQEAAGG